MHARALRTFSLLLLLLVGCRASQVYHYDQATLSAPAPVLRTSSWLEGSTATIWRAERILNLARTPKDTRIRIACDQGIYSLTVNGQPVREQRHFARRPAPNGVYFDEIPILFAKGTNCVTLTFEQTPRFICEILADGDVLGSDHLWSYAETLEAPAVLACREVDSPLQTFWTDTRPAIAPKPTATFTTTDPRLTTLWAQAITNDLTNLPPDQLCLIAPDTTQAIKADLLYSYLAGTADIDTLLRLLDYWRWTGDKDFVRNLYPLVWRTIAQRRSLPSGLWEPTARTRRQTPLPRVHDNILQLRALKAAAELSAALGKVDEAKAFAVATQKLKLALVRERRGDGLYAAKPEVNALAVLAGCSLSNRDFLRKHLLSAPATPLTLSALCKLAQTPADAEAIIAKATQLPHGTLQLPLELIAGVSTLEEQASRIRLAPNPGKLQDFALRVATPPTPDQPAPTLQLNWQRLKQGSQCRVTVPQGVTIEMRYPIDSDVRSLRVNGELIWRRTRGVVIQKHLRFYQLRDDRLIFELPAGEWVIDAAESTAIRPTTL